MSSQVSWLVDQKIVKVSVQGILQGYMSDELAQDLMTLVDDSNTRNRIHVMVDVSNMLARNLNAELLYNAITPLLFEHHVRWIVLYGASDELNSIFKEIMFDLFRNPCVLLKDYDAALNFLARKHRVLYGMLEKAS